MNLNHVDKNTSIVDNDNHVKAECPKIATAIREEKNIKWHQILQIRDYLILISNIPKLPMTAG